MIIIGIPHIREDQDNAFLENEIQIDGVKKLLWFKVDRKYRDYLCVERGDAYLVAALRYAMTNGHDFKIDVPVSEKLLFNLQTYLIPALIENNPDMHLPKIDAVSANDKLPNAGAVGTGISCGVDSLHALATKTNTRFAGLNVTHLAFNNVGSHGDGEQGRELYRKRLERPEKFARECGFEFVASDSNLTDVIDQVHYHSHTYSSMFPVLCLQKLYRAYYYASGGYRFNEFNLHPTGYGCCGAYELLSLPSFSTDVCTIYSDGMGKTRLKKLQEVVKYAPSYKYLNVCLTDGDNCGHCEKCSRTLLGLDALGALDSYREVFDIDAYRANRKWHLQQLMYWYKDGKHDYIELYPMLKHDVTPAMRIKAAIYVPVKRFIKKRPALRNRILKLMHR